MAPRSRPRPRTLLLACCAGYLVTGQSAVFILSFPSLFFEPEDNSFITSREHAIGLYVFMLFIATVSGAFASLVAFACLMLGRMLRVRETLVWIAGPLLVMAIVVSVQLAVTAMSEPGGSVPMSPLLQFGTVLYCVGGTPLAALAAYARWGRVLMTCLAVPPTALSLASFLIKVPLLLTDGFLLAHPGDSLPLIGV